ncbi:MAG TPA: PHB depolymerase family esterase, partial [Candidatus Ozemobacteraceae bacterium]|nr:PHB depolymerase family esterase [Candidatus Ozemobacteraceae bacterium]
MWKKLVISVVVLCVGTSLLCCGYVWNYRRQVEAYARAERRSLQFGPLTRTYELFVPKNVVGSSPVPLLLVLHGGGGTGRGMQYLTLGRFNELAEREGFVVAYPDGLKKNWNDGRDVPASEAHASKLDDVGFLKALIQKLQTELSIDPSRIYACGISNGAFMSARLAIEAPDVFAAVALVTGSLPT